MKVTVERAALLKSIGHVHRVVERRNTIPILANLLIRAEKGKLGLKATDLDLEVVETIPAEVSPAGSTTVPAHMIYDIVRKLPEGAQIVLDSSGDRASLDDPRRPLALLAADAARERLPGSRGRRDDAQVLASRQGPEAADRQDAVRDLDRGDALLSQRHLSARRDQRQGATAARGRDRRASPGAGRARRAEGRRGHAGHHRAAQDGRRGAAPDRGSRRRGRDRAVADARSASRSARWC